MDGRSDRTAGVEVESEKPDADVEKLARDLVLVDESTEGAVDRD